MMHEFVWMLKFTPTATQAMNATDKQNFYPTHGRTTIFFLWNAMLIILEKILARRTFFQSTTMRLPRPLITFLVVISTLPLANLMLYDLINGHVFEHHMMTVPLIVRI